jgi:hypothetical protein
LTLQALVATVSSYIASYMGAGWVSEYLTKRNGGWHYQRRVPEEYAAFDTRVPVRLTTGI